MILFKKSDTPEFLKNGVWLFPEMGVYNSQIQK